MTILEFIQSEKETMQPMSTRERVAHIWGYYKWYILIGMVALLLLVQFAASAFGQKDAALNGILLDGKAPADTPAILQEFCDTYSIDTDSEEVRLSTGLSLNSAMPDMATASYQRIYAGVGAKDIDFITGYSDAIAYLAYDPGEIFCDLRDVFSAETLTQWEEYLYYIDANVVEAISQGTQEEIPLPDPRKPEEMQNPVPVAIDLSSCEAFTSAYYGTNQAVYIAVVGNAPHGEIVVQFVEFLLS